MEEYGRICQLSQNLSLLIENSLRKKPPKIQFNQNYNAVSKKSLKKI